MSSRSVKRLLLDRTVMWAGLEGRWLSDDLARAFKVPQPAGYLVTSVTKGSDPDAFGIRGGTRRETVVEQDVMIGGDILLKVQGVSLTAPGDLPKIREALSLVPEGQEIRVTLLRSGRVVELKGRRPK